MVVCPARTGRRRLLAALCAQYVPKFRLSRCSASTLSTTVVSTPRCPHPDRNEPGRYLLRRVRTPVCAERPGQDSCRLGMPTGAVGICDSTRAECPFGRRDSVAMVVGSKGGNQHGPYRRARLHGAAVGSAQGRFPARQLAHCGMTARTARCSRAALLAASVKPCLRESHRSRCLVGRPGNRLAAAQAPRAGNGASWVLPGAGCSRVLLHQGDKPLLVA